MYPKTPQELYGNSMGSLTHYADTEIKILKLLRKKITNKNISPCILELIESKVCNNLSRIIPDRDVCESIFLNRIDNSLQSRFDAILCKMGDQIRAKTFHNKCAFLILDKCDVTFDDFLQKHVDSPVNMAVFKSILFMIVYTIYSICEVYPGFHHYDLHSQNIMIKFDLTYKFNINNPRFLVFHVKENSYVIPYFGIIPKIIDFGYSTIPEEGIISSKTGELTYMFHRSNNDLIFLFHHIYSIIAYHHEDTFGKIDKLLTQLDPTRSFVNYYTTHIRKIEKKIPSYTNMINNKAWDEYKNKKINPSQIHNEFRSV
jgi:hypothetical protein